MASNVDPTIPADNVKPRKADFRDNFLAIKTEIEALQTQTSLARKMINDTRIFKEL